MKQFQKGYSVLENIPEEKITDDKDPEIGAVKIPSQFGRREILWHCFIFALLAILVFVWAFVLLNLQHAWNENHHEKAALAHVTKHFVISQDLDPVAKPLANFPIDILESLNEGDLIQGDAWKAWNDVEDSVHQPICKVDNGVSGSGIDVVVKRFTIYSEVAYDGSGARKVTTIYVDPTYFVPTGHILTGVIAIDHKRTETMDGCYVDTVVGGAGLAAFRLESTTQTQGTDLHFTFLLIGRKSGSGVDGGEMEKVGGGESIFGNIALAEGTPVNGTESEGIKETRSDEDFNSYVH